MSDAIIAVYPLMKVDEGADRTEIGRSSWTIGLTRRDGSSAEIQVATDEIRISDMGDLSCWSLWDENAELRDEPLQTMGISSGAWAYYHKNDPFNMPLAIEKTLGSATQAHPAVR